MNQKQTTNLLYDILDKEYRELFEAYKKKQVPEEMIYFKPENGEEVYTNLWSWETNQYENAMFTCGYIRGIKAILDKLEYHTDK